VVAVPAHGLFDGVGEGRGAQAELGLRAREASTMNGSSNS